MKHYSKEKTAALISILRKVAKQDPEAQTSFPRSASQNVLRMFLGFISETGEDVVRYPFRPPKKMMSHRARWRTISTGVLAMRYMATNFWMRRYMAGTERPICAIAGIVDAIDRFTGSAERQAIERLVKPLLRELEQS